jgi:hypothetical protein
MREDGSHIILHRRAVVCCGGLLKAGAHLHATTEVGLLWYERPGSCMSTRLLRWVG